MEDYLQPKPAPGGNQGGNGGRPPARVATGEAEPESEGNDYLFTLVQAANYMQLAPSVIYSYIRSGKLKAYHAPGKRKILIRRRDLLTLLEQ